MKPSWPELNYIDGKDTYETLRLFTQIIGKIKLAKLPWINHSWHVTLLVTPFGLTTLSLPDKNKSFQLDLDLTEHNLIISTSEGEIRKTGLKGISVAGLYKWVFGNLNELDIEVIINKIPNEIENAIPFDQDNIHAVYNPEQAELFHKALLKIQDVFTHFRSEFIGKCSPVHFFWGSFDFAVSRFSGRKAPKHPGGVPNLPDWVVQEAYSHEVCSAGFWPGDPSVPFAAFYSYGYPEPEGYKEYAIKPAEAYYDKNLREFILPYRIVQQSDDPSGVLLEFLRSTWEAEAVTGKWDTKVLEAETILSSHS